jgi:NAD(P)-dependent dehydrogenase (short-subunit alcohol dehydrogenase family)
MSNFKNKVVVVTGGNSGIGYATAKEFVAAGAKVVITGRNKQAVDKAASEIKAEGIVSDQGDLKAIDQLVAAVNTRYGKVDILFINAGVAAFAPLEAVTEEQFDTILGINFKGAYFTLQKFLPLLKEGSSVTFLSSVNATAAMANSSVYGTSKAALNSLTKIAASELAPKKIRVNSVSPGPIETPIFGKLGMPEEALQQFGAAITERVPLKRIGTSEEVAKLVLFLSSDDAAFITGSDYVIDGGVILNPVLG